MLPAETAAGGNPRPGYWAVPPQPHVPAWPSRVIPPYGVPPPYAPLPPEPPQPPIGPDRVPWKWYDVLVAALPLIFTLALNVVAQLVSPTTTGGTQDVPISTPVLIANTVVGVVIYGVILLLIWAMTVRKYRLSWSALGVRRVPGLYLALFIPILAGMYFLASLVSLLIVQLFYGGHATNPQEKDITGGGSFSWLRLILALITASIAAPMVEELFFRGVLYAWLRTRWHAVGGVILSAAIFSGAHAIPLILAAIFVVGITLAIVYEKTKSTLATMLLHSAFNTIGVIVVFVQLARK